MTRSSENEIHRRNEMLHAWCGLVLVFVTLTSLVLIARLIPPPPAYLSAEQVAALYRDRQFPILFGLFLSVGATSLLIPFSAGIAVQMARIEGSRPVLAVTQVAAGAVGSIILIVAMILMMAAAYDLERPVEITKALHEAGWLMLLLCYSPFCIQYIAIAIFTLQDKSEEPLFPRWIAYYNIWLAISFIPTGWVAFFKTGPFTWHGFIGFWIPIALYCAWFFIMFVALRNASRRNA